MDSWILRSPQIHSAFGSLGYYQNGEYQIREDYLSSLESIYNKLLLDEVNCVFRKAIGLGQNIKNDLIPLLMFTKNDKILQKTIKILVNLTIPAECLLPSDNNLQQHSGRHTLFQLNNLLISAKDCFVNNSTTKVVLDIVATTVERSNGELLEEDCDYINNCLLLLRNILHIPEDISRKRNITTAQNQILWNLFTSGIDKILISLMTSPQSANWSITMVQLIALLYKDQPFNALQKLLNQSMDCLSDSSDDNESTTSPTNRESEGHITSELNSDSSDASSALLNNSRGQKQQVDQKCQMYSASQDQMSHEMGSLEADSKKSEFSTLSPSVTEDLQNFSLKENVSTSVTKSDFNDIEDHGLQSKLQEKNKEMAGATDFSKMNNNIKRKKHAFDNSVLSDAGYATQMEAPDSISASSNEDDLPQSNVVHQKPAGNKQRQNTKTHSTAKPQEKRELRRKRIIRRGKSNIILMKGIMNHTPTDEDIAYVLKEFTVDFLLKGFNSLVVNLHHELITNFRVQIDTSHFFWLITYFLKFASYLEIDLEHIRFVLSYDILSYITSEGVALCEQLEMFKKSGCDLKPYIRRMHLVVIAVKEFLQAIKTYKKFTHLTTKEQKHLSCVEVNICHTRELRCLFVLLLRLYHPELHTKQYLQDLIVTNHLLLLCLDNMNTNLVEHLKQFANVIIIGNYGLMLEDFKNNGEFVNDCIFTMLHHVAGDLNSLPMLFQPSIVKTFSVMNKIDFELCDEWLDLIDWTLRASSRTPDSARSCYYAVQPAKSIPMELNQIANIEGGEDDPERWNQEDAQLLSWYYSRSLQCEDTIKNIVNLYSEGGSIKTNRSVINQLRLQDIIDADEFNVLTQQENLLCKNAIKMDNAVAEVDCDIGTLCEKLKSDNISFTWVQEALLEACYTKLTFKQNNFSKLASNLNTCNRVQLEPVPFYHISMNQPIPIVTWNTDQELACNNPGFLELIKRIGLYTTVDTNKMFIRIPFQWTPEFMLQVALKLGSIDFSAYPVSNLLELKEIERHSSEDADDKNTVDKTGSRLHAHNEPFLPALELISLPGPSKIKHSRRRAAKVDWLEVITKAKIRKITPAIVNESLKTNDLSDVKVKSLSIVKKKEEFTVPKNPCQITLVGTTVEETN